MFYPNCTRNHPITYLGAFCAQKCEDIRHEFDKLQYYLQLMLHYVGVSPAQSLHGMHPGLPMQIYKYRIFNQNWPLAFGHALIVIFPGQNIKFPWKFPRRINWQNYKYFRLFSCTFQVVECPSVQRPACTALYSKFRMFGRILNTLMFLKLFNLYVLLSQKENLTKMYNLIGNKSIAYE